MMIHGFFWGGLAERAEEEGWVWRVAVVDILRVVQARENYNSQGLMKEIPFVKTKVCRSVRCDVVCYKRRGRKERPSSITIQARARGDIERGEVMKSSVGILIDLNDVRRRCQHQISFATMPTIALFSPIKATRCGGPCLTSGSLVG